MTRVTPSQHAFTLIELTLTMLLIVILSSVGIPSFRILYDYTEMQRVTSDFSGALRYAQQRAILERIPIRVEINVDDNSYWVPVEEKKERRHYVTRRKHRSASDRRSSRRKQTGRIREVKEIAGSLPKGFIFEFLYKVSENKEVRRKEGEIYFYPDGSADETFITILWLANTKDEEKRLFMKISPATGLISSMEGRSENDGRDFYRG